MPAKENSRGGLGDHPFAYRPAGSKKVFITWRNRPALTLKGPQAITFLAKIATMSPDAQQLHMAKLTGNFKR